MHLQRLLFFRKSTGFNGCLRHQSRALISRLIAIFLHLVLCILFAFQVLFSFIFEMIERLRLSLSIN